MSPFFKRKPDQLQPLADGWCITYGVKPNVTPPLGTRYSCVYYAKQRWYAVLFEQSELGATIVKRRDLTPEEVAYFERLVANG